MVNFRDPAVVLQDSLAVTKFWHTLAGLYIWEFVTTFDYEWSVIRGHQPYRWTILIYSVMRVATLMGVMFYLVNAEIMANYNCGVEVTLAVVSMLSSCGSAEILACLTIAAASLLIVLRIIAIWNRNKLVMAIATGIWATNIGFLIHTIVQIGPAWAPAEATCIDNIPKARLNAFTTFFTDIILLLIMLLGLLRLGFHKSGMLGLGHFMWRQGLIWLFLATMTYIPPLVFIRLDLNDPLNNLSQFPASIVLTIAATRIHRSLLEFSSRSAEIVIISDKLHPIDFTTSRSDRDPAQPISLEPVEVSEHYQITEQYLTSQSSRHAPFIGRDGSQNGEMVAAAGLGLDYDVDSVTESRTLASHLSDCH